MSKFKLILFDREGGVRAIEESQRNSKSTVAEMFFVPFDHMRLMPMFPMKFYAEDKETPLPFHLLDGELSRCFRIKWNSCLIDAW